MSDINAEQLRSHAAKKPPFFFFSFDSLDPPDRSNFSFDEVSIRPIL